MDIEVEQNDQEELASPVKRSHGPWVTSLTCLVFTYNCIFKDAPYKYTRVSAVSITGSILQSI
jgi:hypothetical protein